MPRVEVTRTYLELTALEELRPFALEAPDLTLERVADREPALYRHLYLAVGGPYDWVDRAAWSDQEILAHLSQACVSVWVLSRGPAPVGYFELAAGPAPAVEIAYFGLFPDQFGRGLGKHLLTLAVERAFALGARRVWLHTCTLDHPAALPNYLARGFRPFRRETYTVEREPGAPLRGKS